MRMSHLILFTSFITYTFPVFSRHGQWREATKEEEAILLKGVDPETFKEIGEKLARDSERSLVEKMIVETCLEEKKLDDQLIKSFIQMNKSHGLTSREIQQQVDKLGNKYFSLLQLSNIDHLLENKRKNYHKKRFDLLQEKFNQNKLNKNELELEIGALNKDLIESPVTKKNELKLQAFKKELRAQIDKFIHEDELTIKSSLKTPLRIYISDDHKFSDPFCLLSLKIPMDDQLDKLTKDLQEITKAQLGKGLKAKQIWMAWGYNRSYHSKSDVEFKTKDGNFTIHDAVGKDRPTPFTLENYFKLENLTIPQYNLEIGIMLTDTWGMDLHLDHMKYVFDNKRPYEITGEYNHKVIINNEHPSDEGDERIPVDFSVAKEKKDATWLKFDHTNGYNYDSIGAVYNLKLFHPKKRWLIIDSRFGAGAGLMIPKTEVNIEQDSRWNRYGIDNKFHLAGGGVHGDLRLKFTFWDAFFFQAATRGTYIKVSDALVDGAEARMEHKEAIFSYQFIAQFGFQKKLTRKKKHHKLR